MSKPKINFIVITKVNSLDGNLATAMDLYQVTDDDVVPPVVVRVNPLATLSLRIPVFHVGEVIIANEDGREIPHPQRKPSKWDVETETFTNLNDALDRARPIVGEW